MITSNSFLNTGLLRGSLITLNTPTTNTFNQDAGEGWYVDDFSTPEREKDPEIRYVKWAAESNVVPQFLNTHPVSYIGKNKDGITVQQNTPYDSADRKDFIQTGQINHPDQIDIAGFDQSPYSPASSAATLRDIVEAIGVINKYGNKIEPRTATTMLKTVGEVVFDGLQLITDKKNRNTRTTSLINDFSTFYSWKDGAGGDIRSAGTFGSPSADRYDDNTGGALEPNGVVPVGSWTIQQVLWAGGPSSIFDPNNAFLFQYGTRLYESLREAYLNLPETNERDSDASMYMRRGWLIIRSGWTDLQDGNQAVFVEADKLGLGKAGLNHAIKKQRAKVSKSDVQSIAPDVWVTLSFDVVDDNKFGIFNPLAPLQLTMQTDGYASVHFDANFSGTNLATFEARILKNGVDQVAYTSNSGSQNNNPFTVGDVEKIRVLRNEILQFQVMHDGAAARNVLVEGTHFHLTYDS